MLFLSFELFFFVPLSVEALDISPMSQNTVNGTAVAGAGDNATTTTSTATMSSADKGTWCVRASARANLTTNPIRDLVDRMDLQGNPDKAMIPLSIGMLPAVSGLSAV